MHRLLERFFRYVSVDTQSAEDTGRTPSSAGQSVLGEMLQSELLAMGAIRVRRTAFGIVFAEIPPSPGCETAPVLGLIAHLDTSNAASGKNVRAKLVHYTGGTVKLGESGRFIAPEEHVGKTLVVTDGTTLLGADDKAGIAEIMTCADALLRGEVRHGKICIAFTPDEEIGEGTDHFDTGEFGADYAYTADGGRAGTIEYQNFNAAGAVIRFQGISIHPGSAFGKMRNAQHLAMAFHRTLPEKDTPEYSSGREGFFHLTGMKGDTGHAELRYILRDFEPDGLEKRKALLRKIVSDMNCQYGAGTAAAEIRDQYRNMEEVIRECPFLIRIAEAAAKKAGLKPEIELIRGGTDGAMLSWKGLPCPNLGTGGYNYHGETEFAVVEEMESACRMLEFLAESFARQRKTPEK